MSIPTHAELVQRAIDMQPTLRERAAATREARRVLPETIEEFHNAGFFKIVQPKSHGGYAMSPKVFYDVVFHIARACPASGWVFSVLGVHNYELGHMSAQAREDVWGEDNKVSDFFFLRAKRLKLKQLKAAIRSLVSGVFPVAVITAAGLSVVASVLTRRLQALLLI